MARQVGGPFDGFEIISEYKDAEAVDDGVLVPIGDMTNDARDRATRHVWNEFTRTIGNVITDITEFKKLYLRVLGQPLKDDWRILPTPKGEVWLIPNEGGGRTLMFASDY